MAPKAEGANGTAIRKTLEGIWLKTIVLSNPMRLAILSAARKDMAVTICVAEKIKPSEVSWSANLS
jgi:hypothetical protein